VDISRRKYGLPKTWGRGVLKIQSTYFKAYVDEHSKLRMKYYFFFTLPFCLFFFIRDGADDANVADSAALPVAE